VPQGAGEGVAEGAGGFAELKGFEPKGGGLPVFTGKFKPENWLVAQD
jgi:hypothetical protein